MQIIRFGRFWVVLPIGLFGLLPCLSAGIKWCDTPRAGMIVAGVRAGQSVRALRLICRACMVVPVIQAVAQAARGGLHARVAVPSGRSVRKAVRGLPL